MNADKGPHVMGGLVFVLCVLLGALFAFFANKAPIRHVSPAENMYIKDPDSKAPLHFDDDVDVGIGMPADGSPKLVPGISNSNQPIINVGDGISVDDQENWFLIYYEGKRIAKVRLPEPDKIVIEYTDIDVDIQVKWVPSEEFEEE